MTSPVDPSHEPDDGSHLGRWYGIATTFVAPATLLSALLFYFGYVTSRAQYAYFGVDVDTLALSTRDFVMRSPQALLVPLLVITLLGAGLLLVHLALRTRTIEPRVVAVAFGLAVGLIVAGLVLLFGFEVFGDLPIYGALTPLLIAAGVGAATYLAGRPGTPRFLSGREGPRAARQGVTFLALVVIATCLFWATATVAEWTGRGTAMRAARDLDRFPLVILDTQERLYLTDGVVTETELPEDEEQLFRYRYRGFRLLVQGGDRMFLVPEEWTPSNSTLVVPLDGSVRVQFRFVNVPPVAAGPCHGCDGRQRPTTALAQASAVIAASRA